jgi:toxin ParE1/3/4
MSVVWTRAVIADLADVRKYVAKDDAQAAADLARRILESVDRLAPNPRLGRAGRVPGTRELVIAGTPYLVVYRVHGRDVELLRVLHGGRRWPPA